MRLAKAGNKLHEPNDNEETCRKTIYDLTMGNKLDRLAFEWVKKHPKATLEEAFKAGYLRHVEAWVKNER